MTPTLAGILLLLSFCNFPRGGRCAAWLALFQHPRPTPSPPPSVLSPGREFAQQDGPSALHPPPCRCMRAPCPGFVREGGGESQLHVWERKENMVLWRVLFTV